MNSLEPNEHTVALWILGGRQCHRCGRPCEGNLMFHCWDCNNICSGCGWGFGNRYIQETVGEETE
jgi:hypothetical protein